MRRKKICPQCGIPNLYVKNKEGTILPVYVFDDLSVHPKDEKLSLEGYNLETIYCLGCSWKGTVNGLKR